MEKKQKEIRFQVTSLVAEKREVDGANRRVLSGYAAVFNKWSEPIYDYFVEQISRTAFNDCDMSDVVMCYNHNLTDILARSKSGTLKLAIDDIGLKFEFEVPDTTLGRDLVELVDRGDLDKCSFAFYVESDTWVYADKDNKLIHHQRTINQISKVVDCSIVVFPAYPDTEVSARSKEYYELQKEMFDKSNTEVVRTNSSVDRDMRFMQLTLNKKV